ncbi:MAG: thioesterase superfamily protein, partial [Pseudonocardiales bacterium]|nr:thioesterase superfamily protein [Pseudonocardiales bacterium]
MTRSSEITLRFLAAPTDVETIGGSVGGGKALEWIDKAAYALSVMWCGGNAVTAYVGDVHFRRPIESGHLVEVSASLVHTGRSSMHIRVVVTSVDPKGGEPVEATDCLVIFVAVDSEGAPVPVPAWTPITDEQRARQGDAVARIAVRARIEAAMSGQTYTDDTTAQRITLRFQAKPTDVNWSGKTHGGNVMRWIDEAAHLCCMGWTGGEAIAVYSGGIRFYRP